MSKVEPPRILRRLLSSLCHPYMWESIEGDLHELFLKDLQQGKGTFRANLNYTVRSLAFLRFRRMLSLLSQTQHNTYDMFKFLFRISSRNLWKHRLVSFMSLLTLILGALSFQLVYSWVHNEETMDEFHEHSDRIYIGTATLTPATDVVAGHIQRFFNLDYAKYPEVEKQMVIHSYQPGEIQFIAAGRSFEGKALIADSTFFDVFSFPVQYGDTKAINDPTSVLITERFAKRVWGDEYAIGKRIEIKCDQEGTYQVAAVLQNIPSNSSVEFDYLIPRHSQPFWRRMPQDFVLLSQGSDIESFNQKVNAAVPESRFKEGEITFMPFNSIYDRHPFHISLFAKYGNKTNFQVMQVVLFALLIMMIFGFANIQGTAQLTMTKKMGIKRVIGAQRRALMFEILVNMLLYFLVAVFVTYALIQVIFSQYMTLMELQIDEDPVLNLQMIISVIGLTVLITAIIQFYNVSGINALSALSGKINFFRAAYRQKAVTSLQYAVAISLLIAASVIYLQIRYMVNEETGLNQEHIIQARFFEILPSARQDSLERERILKQYQYAMDRIRENPDIISVSQGQLPLDYAYNNSWRMVGSSEDYLPIKTMSVDPFYQEVFDLELVKGRFFNDSLDTNGDLKVLINETAMRHWGIEALENATIEMDPRGRSEPRKHKVIGVVKDFHFEHLSQAIQPLVMPYFYYQDQAMLVRHASGRDRETMAFLGGLYEEINAAGFFNGVRFKDRVREQYLTEKKTNKVYLSFGIVTLILSSLSMFTFTFHETRRRTKEIGIRKVNGATVRNIFRLLGSSFLTTVGISFLIASPIVGYLMNLWLDNFANRIQLEWWIFLGVGLMVSVLALLVISWHVIKVAMVNPVKTLRYE